MEMQNMNDRVKVRGMNGAEFGIIQKSVMQDSELYAKAKALYAYLACFARDGDAVSLAKSKICYDLGISKNTLKKYLCSLIKCGYLGVEQFKENGKFSHNVYTLCDPECPPRKRENTVSENTVPGNLDTKNNNYKNNNYINNNNEE